MPSGDRTYRKVGEATRDVIELANTRAAELEACHALREHFEHRVRFQSRQSLAGTSVISKTKGGKLGGNITSMIGARILVRRSLT